MSAKTVKLIPLYHRGGDQIGIKFAYDHEIKELVKGFGARWSQTHRCFYMAHTAKNKKLIYHKLRSKGCYVDYSAMVNAKVSAEKKSAKSVLPESHQFYLDEYKDYLIGQRKSASTVHTYVNFIRTFLSFYADRSVEDIDNRSVEVFLEQVIAKQNYSISSHRQCVSALKHFSHLRLNFSIDPELLDRPKKDKKLPVVLSFEEVLQLIQVTKNLKHRAMIALIYATGMRIGEVLALELSAIDLKRNSIHIKNAKGRKDRTVPLGKQIRQLLISYGKTYRPQRYLFENDRTHQPYSASSVRQFLKRSCRSAGIEKKVTPHTLRHSYATHLLDNGVDIRYIQEFLGHTKPETTMIYTHISHKDLEQITDPLDNAVSKYVEDKKSDKDDKNVLLSGKKFR